MKGASIALRVISLLIIIFAAIMLFFSIVMFMGAGLLNASSPEGWAILALIGAIILLVAGLVYLIIGIFGFLGANNPRRIVPFIVFCIIGVALSAGSFVLNILDGTFDPYSLIGMTIVVVCLVLALIIRKHARDLPQ